MRDNDDKQQDWHPYATVATHPPGAPRATIHHVAVLRQRDTGGEQVQCTNCQSKVFINFLLSKMER